MTVTLFTKPSCVQCTMTKKVLDKEGVSYEVVDVSADDAGLQRIVELGYKQVPVVIAGSDHWSGFRPDRCASLKNSSAA